MAAVVDFSRVVFCLEADRAEGPGPAANRPVGVRGVMDFPGFWVGEWRSVGGGGGRNEASFWWMSFAVAVPASFFGWWIEMQDVSGVSPWVHYSEKDGYMDTKLQPIVKLVYHTSSPGERIQGLCTLVIDIKPSHCPNPMRRDRNLPLHCNPLVPPLLLIMRPLVIRPIETCRLPRLIRRGLVNPGAGASSPDIGELVRLGRLADLAPGLVAARAAAQLGAAPVPYESREGLLDDGAAKGEGGDHDGDADFDQAEQLHRGERVGYVAAN